MALRALGFEPKKEEIKKLISAVSEGDKDDMNVGGGAGGKAHPGNQKLDFNEFVAGMTMKMAEKDTKDQIQKAFLLFQGTTGKITFDDLESCGTLGGSSFWCLFLGN